MNIFLKSTIPAFLAMPLIVNATEITNTQITSTGVKVDVNLDSTLRANEKIKIDYGKGLKAMTCKNKSCSITFTAATALPKNVTKLNYTVGIYNNDVLLNGTLKNETVDFVISKASTAADNLNTISKPTPTGKGDVETFVSGCKTFSYTKIANDGSELPKTAKLGSGAKDWACTKDNNTGLIWEVKITDGGLPGNRLRDRDWAYSWYKPEGDNGGNAGYQNGNGHPEWCKGSECDTYAFTNAVNKQSLCGAKDWRLPNNEELKGLVVCSDNKYNTLADGEHGYICLSNEFGSETTSPTINTTYFPNTQSYYYWSSSPHASSIYNSMGGDSDLAWYVNFIYGDSSVVDKNYHVHIRLVRSGQ